MPRDIAHKLLTSVLDVAFRLEHAKIVALTFG